MNKAQKEVQQAHLNAEKSVLKKLKQIYAQASKDCQQKIQELNSRTDMQNLQSIIYQEQYQEALKKQIDSILDSLQSNEFNTVADYLTECYENGYVGTMYDIQKQGIPIITPINQKNVVKAIQADSKLSTNLYTRLGEDTTKLKKTIRTELSRGTANGSTWLEMAEKISNGMNSPFKTSLNNAIRIARTEGHRIQQVSALDAMLSAKENGADVVKQWDATLDSRTRPDHQEADGQIRELDEYFRVGGEDLKAPGVGGSAKNVINCRCCVLQRARWALDEDELATLKSRASYFGLNKTNSFKEYKEKYLSVTSIITNSYIKDVTNEYTKKATPGIGKISYDKNYEMKSSQTEIANAKWIIDKLGGNIRLLKESKEDYVHTPDSIWNGKIWEFKRASSKNSIDKRIQDGLKQIYGDTPGILLDVTESKLSLDDILIQIQRTLLSRGKRMSGSSVDIMIKKSESLISIVRYEK